MKDYSTQWRRYRALNRAVLVAFAAFLGVLAAAVVIDRLRVPTVGAAKAAIVVLASATLLSMWIVVAMIAFWRCPRCSEWFSRRRLIGIRALRRQCVHCGLRLYESDVHSDAHEGQI